MQSSPSIKQERNSKMKKARLRTCIICNQKSMTFSKVKKFVCKNCIQGDRVISIYLQLLPTLKQKGIVK